MGAIKTRKEKRQDLIISTFQNLNHHPHPHQQRYLELKQQQTRLYQKDMLPIAGKNLALPGTKKSQNFSSWP
jgi:hypothetical protein